ncbi:MAG: PASTA domain-containing protein [Bacteroidales bacterium]|nr:PASTA domain-containing protein [Bacteroidales bacterium]
MNWIVKNIIKAAVFFLTLVIVAQIVLKLVTHHGQMIEVPDLTSMSVEEARREASKDNLRTEVIDSIFVRRMEKGAVYSQNPKAGTMVKKGRRVMLTINAKQAKKVSMPNLVGYSMRQAKAELNSRGLALGKLIYVNDIATNNVLRQIYRNREIRPGVQIESGSEIDLQVGLNSDDNMTYVPNVKGMKYLRAVDAVHDNSLNIGRIVFDKTVKNYSDSLNAMVYKQTPGASKSPLLMGSDVTLHLSLDIKENY